MIVLMSKWNIFMLGLSFYSVEKSRKYLSIKRIQTVMRNTNFVSTNDDKNLLFDIGWFIKWIEITFEHTHLT